MNKRTKLDFSGISVFAKLGVITGVFLIMLIACGACIGIISKFGLSERVEALTLASLQAILVFIIPAFIFSKVFYASPVKALSLEKSVDLKEITGIILIFIISLPALNQLIQWNESITFPSILKGVEKVFRSMEDTALESTKLLLNTTSTGGLISGILIIGFLTGFAEELFFRGALQTTLIKSNYNPVFAIWLTAFIFSAIHFQFYGFFPRLLLGAFFGYLLIWTKSIWASAFAHALNNSLVVLFTWLNENKIFNFTIEDIGVTKDSFPWMAIGSVIILIIFLRYGKNFFFERDIVDIKLSN